MKVYALLSWFDECPLRLAAAVASCHRFADHVVAFDGAYASFPDAAGSSGAFQHRAIVDAAEAVGLGLTLHVPAEPWTGNEVEKREALFSVACWLAEPGVDWLFVIDADERVISAPDTLRWELERAEEHVGEVTLTENGSQTGARRLLRASEHIRVVGNHFTWVDAEGRVLRGDGGEAAALNLPGVVVRHLHDQRDEARNQRARVYADRRERYGLEAPAVEV